MRWMMAISAAIFISATVANGTPQATLDGGFHDPRIQESFLAHTPAGGWVLHLQNNSPNAVTAYAVLKRDAGQNGQTSPAEAQFVDSASGSDPRRAGFPGPNGSADYVFLPGLPAQFAGKYPPPAEVSLLAVVFDDGSSAGDPTWASAILAARKARLQALQNVLPMLSAIQAGKQPVGDVIGQLQQATKQLLADYNPRVTAAFRAFVRDNPGETVPSGAILLPVESAQFRAQDGVYEGTADNLRNAQNSGNLPNMLKILIRSFSQSIQALQNSKPALK